MKRIILIGATSGIGYETARLYIRQGWRVGIAGRRVERLESLQQEAPDRVSVQQIDVTLPEATDQLYRLIDLTGGMDVFLFCSGIGSQNRLLEIDTELATIHTNVTGFSRMVITAWQYFRQQGYGHIAAVTSIAGTKGLGIAPAYSATKRYQNTYLDALAQLSRMERLPIGFTDIRPGFVQTALLKNDRYPLLMQPDKVARQIVRAIGKKKRRIVIDWRYAVLVSGWKLLPQWLWERLRMIRT